MTTHDSLSEDSEHSLQTAAAANSTNRESSLSPALSLRLLGGLFRQFGAALRWRTARRAALRGPWIRAGRRCRRRGSWTSRPPLCAPLPRCSATSRLGFRLLIRCLAGRAAQEFLKDRPVSEAVNVQGSTNYKKYSMYKDDKTTHSRTQHGPSDMTVLPKTQGQARSPLAAAPRGPPPPRHPGA